MPSTKTLRVGKPGPVTYSVMFPKGSAHLKANQRARVAVGDKGVQDIVDRDVAADAARRQSTDHNNP